MATPEEAAVKYARAYYAGKIDDAVACVLTAERAGHREYMKAHTTQLAKADCVALDALITGDKATVRVQVTIKLAAMDEYPTDPTVIPYICFRENGRWLVSVAATWRAIAEEGRKLAEGQPQSDGPEMFR